MRGWPPTRVAAGAVEAAVVDGGESAASGVGFGVSVVIVVS